MFSYDLYYFIIIIIIIGSIIIVYEISTIEPTGRTTSATARTFQERRLKINLPYSTFSVHIGRIIHVARCSTRLFELINLFNF